MTQLYRITYVRHAVPCSVTFSAVDVVDAAKFSELWERTMKLPVLTLKAIGASKIPQPPWERWTDQSSQALPGGEARRVEGV